MSYISLALPPGVYRNGTQYQSKGRYYDSSLVRWFSGEMRPVGGWATRYATPVTGKGRAVLTWADNANTTWVSVATEQKLYVYDQGSTQYDITPAGFTVGYADADTGGGYGMGDYGDDDYGTIRTGTDILPATVWTLDNWGQNLVGCNAEDGKLYQWPPDTTAIAAAVANAPTMRSVVVTPERIVFALGAGGDPRKVQWSDQEDIEDWDIENPTNLAGDFNLQTSGVLVCGRRVKGATLLFTSVDVHRALYEGEPFIYGFERLATGCGIISEQAVVVADESAIWMSQNGFMVYNGFVQPLPCDVHDYVFSDLNTTQASKIHAVHNSAFGEVWFFYPSSGSTEIDRYVSYNYRENHWATGQLSRLSGADRGVIRTPIMIGSDGLVYNHETGLTYDPGTTIYARGGPVELGKGDKVIYALQFVPDEKTSGQVTATFHVRQFPNASESTFGPYSTASKVDVRFTGRQLDVTYNFVVGDDGRVGNCRLDVRQGGRR